MCVYQLKKALSDKSSDVRKATYNLIGDCLQFFSYPDLKINESILVVLLLSGLGDMKPELRKYVQDKFNVCGASRKKLEDEMDADREQIGQ